MPEAPARQRARPRRRVVRRVVVGVLIVLLGWAVVAALKARASIQRAEELLSDARDAETTDTATMTRALDRAGAELRRARGWLRQPGPALVAKVPVLGRS